MAEFDTQLHQDRERLDSTTRAASNTPEADAPKPTGKALAPPGTRQHSRVCGCSECAWAGSMAPGIVTNGLPRIPSRRERRFENVRKKREAFERYIREMTPAAQDGF